MNFDKVCFLLLDYARENGLTNETNYIDQFSSLLGNIEKFRDVLYDREKDKMEIYMGEILKDIILLCRQLNISHCDCINMAYDRMVVEE